MIIGFLKSFDPNLNLHLFPNFINSLNGGIFGFTIIWLLIFIYKKLRNKDGMGLFFGGMDSIARGMVESKEPTDLLDEKKLFTTNAEVQALIEGLFNKDKKHETQ